MKFLIVGLIKGSQIRRLTEEASKLGHTVVGCHTTDLIIRSDGQSFDPRVQGQFLALHDLVYLCAGVETKRRFEWYVAADYLKKHSKTKIVNDVVVDPKFGYYPVQTWFYSQQVDNQIPFPETYTVYSPYALERITMNLGLPIIVKLSETHQGKGVNLATSIEEIEAVMAKNPGGTFLLRKFIPNDGDIRIFTVGFKAIGAMKRTPKAGDFRSNISAGGSGEVFDLAKYPEIQELAEKVARVTQIEVAGVDIIIDKETGKPYVLEVNVGPQFRGLEKFTGVNVAGEIVRYFVAKCANTKY